jgi:hypothetical protein
MESERGWGQDFWDTDYNTEAAARAAMKDNDDRNPPGPAPDYYIQAWSGPEKVWVDKPPTDENHTPKHRKE